MAYTVKITPANKTVNINESVLFALEPLDPPLEGIFTYEWFVDGVSSSTSRTFTYVGSNAPGTKAIKIVSTYKATEEGPEETSEDTTNLTIVIDESTLPYIHPLPQRNTAYIWCGWWVLYEIQDMTLAGKDWKTEDPNSKYYLHRYTLAKMLADYPEVDVQESRNGYILHRSAFDVGIFY
ncbi:head decoration protein [Shewanella phage Thanatos-1]|nr:head decoration protein [Shewanella phage Thanatos-1]